MVQTTPVYGIRYRELTDTPDIAAGTQFVAEDVEDALSDGSKGLVVASITAGGDALTGSGNGVNAFAVTSGTDTTTSASYVNLAGTGSATSFSLTKRYAATRIRVQVGASCYATGSVSGALFGVRINSVDNDVVMVQTSVVNERVSNTGVAYISGVGAGSWTIQGRWRRHNGSGTMTRDVFDWLTIDAREVA